VEHLVTRPEIEAAAYYVREHTRHEPEFGLVLGSGLSSLAEAVEDPDLIAFHDIPNFPVSSVVGHSGRLVFGKLEGRSVLVMQGRVHFMKGTDVASYASHPHDEVAGYPHGDLDKCRGGINPAFKPATSC
jgi:purine-nucleoside phosphorylase